MDISKIAYKIYKLFYNTRKEHYFELRPRDVFDEKDKYGLASASYDEIRGAFSRLKQELVIDVPEGTDRFTITSTGKSTPPEYLIWKEQKEAYDKLDKKMKARKWWVLGVRAGLGMFALLLLAFVYNSIFRAWLSPYAEWKF